MKRPSDEEILARIIAGAKASGRRVMRGDYGVWNGDMPDGPVCAVGAGCLYAGISKIGDQHHRKFAGPAHAFAEAHGTSFDFALGVSDGFETLTIARVMDRKDDYERGVNVGIAAFAALVEDAP